MNYETIKAANYKPIVAALAPSSVVIYLIGGYMLSSLETPFELTILNLK